MHLGFDVGGTNMVGVAVGDDFTRPIARVERRTVHDSEVIVGALRHMIEELSDLTGTEPRSAGVGIAGLVDREGTLWYSPNIHGVVDLPLRRRLEEMVTGPVMVENDANAAAWAEHRIGAGEGVDHLALVTLGTGIGTGFVFDGKVYRGWNGFAGESGHMIIDMHGDVHVTGARGPWELRASGSGLGTLTRAAAARGELPDLVARVGSIDELTGEHLSPAIMAGEPEAMAVFDVFVEHVSVGLANLVHILDVEMLVIGGGLVELGDVLIERLRAATDERILGGPHRPRPRIVPAQLSSEAGAIGAALLAADELG